ncbi:hypothetical protein B9479_005325, partial [Cryptococcus floricola]
MIVALSIKANANPIDVAVSAISRSETSIQTLDVYVNAITDLAKTQGTYDINDCPRMWVKPVRNAFKIIKPKKSLQEYDDKGI